MKIEPHGAKAARLRQRKFEIVRRFQFPEDLLSGSLSLSRRRCGKVNCHCASGEGHPIWLLTYSLRGKKRVERIPEDWAEEIGKRVDSGRQFKDALSELGALNAELLALWRQQKGR